MARREPLPPPRPDGEPPAEDEHGDDFPRIVIVLGIVGFTLGIALLIVVAMN